MNFIIDFAINFINNINEISLTFFYEKIIYPKTLMLSI